MNIINLDQLYNELHENWYSSNIDETTYLACTNL